MKLTPKSEGNAALLVAEGGLWVTLVGGVVSLVTALRPALAYEWAFTWSLPGLLGGRTYAPSLPATIKPDDPGLQLPMLPWKDTSNGTVDAATGLAPVTFGAPVQAHVWWAGFDLTTMEMIAWLAPPVLAAVCVIWGSWLLLRLVRSARAGEVFTLRNAVRLRWLAAIIGVGGLLHNALDAWGTAWILGRSAAASHLDTSSMTVNIAPVWVSLVVAALAVIWEHGVRLARDADGLV